MMLAALAILASASAAQMPAPLPPSGKWVVEYADSMCVLSRNFGIGDAQVTFGLRPFPIASSFELVLVSRDRHRSKVRRGEARMTIGAAREAVTADYVSVALAKSGKRLTAFYVTRDALDGLIAGEALTIEIGKDERAHLAPKEFAAALRALDACQNDLLQGWGVDPIKLAAIAQRAEAMSDTLGISDKDYPSDAKRAGAQGTNAILWTVGIDGRVSDCRVVSSAGNASLDRAGCDAVTKRGRYKPARDKSGKPVVSWDSRRIRWLLPD